MSKKKLHTTLEAKMMLDPRADITLDNLLNRWGSIHYGHLSVLLAHLRFLDVLHHQHHWVARGENSYSDHLLFQRLYEDIREEIDSVAERAIGLGDVETVDLQLQIQSLYAITKECDGGTSTVGSSVGQLAQKSLAAEYTFLKILDSIKSQLDANGLLTYGLDDLLAEIAGKHEEHVYLLRQRVE